MSKSKKSRGFDWAKGLTKETDERILKAQKSRESNPEWKNILINNLPKPKLDGKLEKIKVLSKTMSQHEIAERLCVGQSAISHFMKRHGIKAKPKYVWSNRDPKKQKEINRKISVALRGNNNWISNNEYPNKEEQKLIQFFRRRNLPFEYIGDGSFKIDGKNPDFKHKTKKILIEFFGEFWHPKEDEEKRINFFKERGWYCLVIWGRETGTLGGKRISKLEVKLYNKIVRWLAGLDKNAY